MNRRQFLRAASAGVPVLMTSCGQTDTATTEPALDLVIRGGRVIDPANGIDAVMDVGISGDTIAAVAPNLDAGNTQVLDAADRLVVPGLIDIHVHARDAELPPSEFLSTGVTTMVDAGSRGADNVKELIDDFAIPADNRMRIMLNIGRLGNFPNGIPEFIENLDQADVKQAIAAVEMYGDWIVGIKARLSQFIARDEDQEVLRRAIEAADATGLPVMIHIGDTYSPLPVLLDMLRPGDIVTHMAAPNPHGILDDNMRILPEVWAARERGIRFDFGNGLNEHWAWPVAQAALEQGFPPDTITSDLTVTGRTEQVIDLPNVVSKWLLLGMPLNDAIACVTSNAAATFRQLNPYGTLSVGAPADVTILELAEGDFDFVDNYKAVRKGTQRLMTRGVVMGGKQFT